VLIVEQKLDDLAGIADRVILIEGGVITREGTPGEVLQHPGDGGIRPIESFERS